MFATATMTDSLSMVVTDSEGKIKDVKFIHKGKEFVPNKLYLKLINSGHIQPTEWKIPFLLGTWKAIKE